jgi:hypothetical protein
MTTAEQITDKILDASTARADPTKHKEKSNNDHD